jgi:APA family basic amino acid/polyamine antiporter
MRESASSQSKFGVILTHHVSRFTLHASRFTKPIGQDSRASVEQTEASVRRILPDLSLANVSTATQSPAPLRRQLGLWSATALVVGEVIAVGIFLTPAQMSKSIGSPVWIAVVWLAVGAMSLCGALCYGELAARYPEAGGGYVYLREAYGPRLAFLYGWQSFLVMDPGLTAALGIGLASYAGYIVHLSPLGTKAVALAAIWGLAAANMLGVKLGAALMRWLTFLKLGLLALIILWTIIGGLGNWSNLLPLVAQHEASSPLAGAMAGGLVAAFFSFGGWWDLSKLAGEVREPSKTLPRALALGVIGVTVVYLLTSVVFLYLVPVERVTSGETFAAQAGEVLFGRAGGQVFSAIVMISVLGSLAAVIMSAPRVYYAMARDQLFVPGAAAIHPRFGTPARAIALQAAMASVLVALGTFNEIIAYFIFITVVFIALTIIAVFVLRRRAGRSAYMMPGYPVVPIVFLILVSALLVLLAVGKPRESLCGVAVVVAGLPVYHLLFRKRKPTNDVDKNRADERSR